MRVSLDWLREWVDVPPVAELEHALTQGGLEIEASERSGSDLSGIVVGLVLECGPHPGADRLSVCRVDVGGGEPLPIVCGASNVAAGQKVAVAPPGVRLPDGTKIKKSKIRGEVSRGMICSTRELELGDEHDGILVLDPDAQTGASFEDVGPAGDRVLDIFLTPNRGDCASLLGIAREVSAHFGGAVRLPDAEPPSETGPPAADAISVDIDDAAGCHRYVARLVRGVTVGPSPDWMQKRLEAAGMRPINVVVDVTNYVLLEYGEPLHAFDLATLRGAQVHVRAALPDEKIATLDGETHSLVAEDLVIADAERAIAVAGVMGGAETEVRSDTRDVLIEAAHFHPTRVRRTARRLGISSEASYRFERGVDRAGIRRAADRAALLLAELSGGQVAPGVVEAEGAPTGAVEEIELRASRVNRVLGTALGAAEIATLLSRVGVGVTAREDGDLLRCTIPTWRNDIALPIDLVEEVARIHGYDQIPATRPLQAITPVVTPRSRAVTTSVRDALVGAGLAECMTLPMVSDADLDRIGLAADDPRRRSVAVLNPLVDEESQLRTTLVPSLLEVVKLNRSRQREAVRLFEITRTFAVTERGRLPDEGLQLGIVLAGSDASLWSPGPGAPVFFELKGLLERIFAGLRLGFRTRAGGDEPWLHPGASARVALGKRDIGSFGELHPQTAARYGIEGASAVAVLDLVAMAERPPQAERFEEVSRQPSVRRDLALLLPSTVAAGEVLEAIRSKAGPRLVSAGLFDRYEGRGVPDGQVSLAFRLVFQHPEHTLEDAEITATMERVTKVLADRFGGSFATHLLEGRKSDDEGRDRRADL